MAVAPTLLIVGLLGTAAPSGPASDASRVEVLARTLRASGNSVRQSTLFVQWPSGAGLSMRDLERIGKEYPGGRGSFPNTMFALADGGCGALDGAPVIFVAFGSYQYGILTPQPLLMGDVVWSQRRERFYVALGATLGVESRFELRVYEVPPGEVMGRHPLKLHIRDWRSFPKPPTPIGELTRSESSKLGGPVSGLSAFLDDKDRLFVLAHRREDLKDRGVCFIFDLVKRTLTEARLMEKAAH